MNLNLSKKFDLNGVLVIGSGPITIGQACEFDYSGTQAIKALKGLGYRVILINSNPASIMTDPDFADRTYIEPITKEIILDIIRQEKVDAILPTMGGQTALNIAIQMHDAGLLDGIKFLGASPDAIKKGENRSMFKEVMSNIGMDLARSCYAYDEREAVEAVKSIGFPVVVRSSCTLAGGGSGVAYNMDEFREVAKFALSSSPIGEILIEESLLGWKEYEMEVMRDKNDNCVVVCSIENVDPVGIHTGDSITIAPALTLTDKEYQKMRDLSFSVLREVGIEAGGSNVQFAVNPSNGRMVVIEMNPRVSRSSALASKATGYPIAKIATLLSVGFTLDEILNDSTGMVASFEPSIDYIVTKVPRFNFERFPSVNSTLGTSMKSVGETMGIGGSFKESLQKAMCSLETGIFGLNHIEADKEVIKREIRRPNENRLLYIAEGFRLGMSIDEIYDICAVDKWFLNQISEIVSVESLVTSRILNDKGLMRKIKSYGFSDPMISFLLKQNDNIDVSQYELYKTRVGLGVHRTYCSVDTCSAEFPALTSYLYSRVGDFDEIEKKFFNNEGNGNTPSEPTSSDQKKKVLIIGSGPNRIGQGIEFDYCCVHASYALKDMGIKSIMYNCNPETVSTDYDISDVLYFEPIDFEHVLSVIDKEKPYGIILHFGGQTPLKIARDLARVNVKIMGTSAKTIDIAEDRKKFSNLMKDLNIRQPANGMAKTKEQAFGISNEIGFPILVRPSYVLGGHAMRIIQNNESLGQYMDMIMDVCGNSPVLIDKFLEEAIELDVDCISDGRDLYVGGLLQHIEEAGIHSGDSASILPAISIDAKYVEEIYSISARIALKLEIVGFMNIQFAIYRGCLYVIEVNPRASRSVPFISKSYGIPLAKIATRVMCGFNLSESIKFYDERNIVEEWGLIDSCTIFLNKTPGYYSVKESVFPFNKLIGADLLLGPEMKSTGEVMGISEDFGIAFNKSQISCRNPLPETGNIFISLKDSDKKYAVELANEFISLGFSIVATLGTHKILTQSGVKSQPVLKISEGRPHVVDMIVNMEIDMVVNTSDENVREDARLIREAVIRANAPYFTTISGVRSAAIGMKSATKLRLNKAVALQDYLGRV